MAINQNKRRKVIMKKRDFVRLVLGVVGGLLFSVGLI